MSGPFINIGRGSDPQRSARLRDSNILYIFTPSRFPILVSPQPQTIIFETRVFIEELGVQALRQCAGIGLESQRVG